MYTIGYIDDDNELVSDYVKRLKRNDIDLKIAPVGTMPEIKQWIVDSGIETMLIDQQLKAEYDFLGTELCSYLFDELQGLPCFILTSYTDSSVNENKVIKNCIIDRDVLTGNEQNFWEFCESLKQSTEVFKTNIRKYKTRFESLYKKKSDGTIKPDEEEDLMSVFKVLKAYGEVDDISAKLLTTKVDKALDAIIAKLDEYLKQ